MRLYELELRKRPVTLTARQPDDGLPEVARGPITHSDGAATILRALLSDRLAEAFVVVHLDARHKIVGFEEVSRGGINAVSVSPREVFRGALVSGAASILIAHNHPSGASDPSVDDLKLTRILCDAGELLGVPVVDHIIIGNGEHTSLLTTHKHLFIKCR